MILLTAIQAINTAFQPTNILKAGALPSINKALANLSKVKSTARDSSKSKSQDATSSETKTQDIGKQIDVLESENFDELLDNLPPVPGQWNLLASILGKLYSLLGLDIVQFSPCHKCTIGLVPGCLCPKVSLQLPKLPTVSFSGVQVQKSASAAASAGGSASAAATSSATASSSASGTGSATATGTAAGPDGTVATYGTGTTSAGG